MLIIMLGASFSDNEVKLKLLTLTLYKLSPQVVKGSKITSLLLKLSHKIWLTAGFSLSNNLESLKFSSW